MKIKVYYTSIFLILALLIQCSRLSRDEVIIVDQNFLDALLDQGVDRNNDGMISVAEAERIEAIHLWPSNVKDLTGLEAFINLDTLSVHLNPISSINLSKNKALRYLELIGCELLSLDVSDLSELSYLDCSGSLVMKNYLSELILTNNEYLEHLICSENQLQFLDVSYNVNLKTFKCAYNKIEKLDLHSNLLLNTLGCNNNLLETLDVSHNRALINLISCGNRLSSLDISSNTKLLRIGFDNMLSLNEVCVWTLPFPPPGIVVLMEFSPNVEFSMNCK